MLTKAFKTKDCDEYENLTNSKASNWNYLFLPQLTWNNVGFTVCSVKSCPDSESCKKWALPFTNWTKCLGVSYSGPLPVLCGRWFVQHLVTMEIYSNEASFQSWPHCTCMYDALNPHGLHTLHPAARQRAKEDGHEGSQHWFLQAKPLAPWCQVICFLLVRL